MKLDIKKEYNPVQVLINSNKSNTSKNIEIIATIVACKITQTDKLDIINELCTLCMKSKSIQLVRQKSI